MGLTERRARGEYDCVVAVVPYADLDRGVIDGRPEGFCKLVVDRSSRWGTPERTDAVEWEHGDRRA